MENMLDEKLMYKSLRDECHPYLLKHATPGNREFTDSSYFLAVSFVQLLAISPTSLLRLLPPALVQKSYSAG